MGCLQEQESMGKIPVENDSEIANLKSHLISVKASSDSFDSAFCSAPSHVFELLEKQAGAHTLNVQAADTLLIWYLRAIQAIKAGSDKRSIQTELQSSDRVFNWLTCLLNFSHSAQMNAGLGLLKRLIQFILTIDDIEGENLCSKWALQMFENLSNKKEGYQLLECLAKECPAVSNRLIEQCPQLVTRITDSLAAGAIANAASKCLASILLGLHPEYSSEEDFIAFWAPSVIVGLQNPALKLNITQHLLPLLLRMTSNTVEIFSQQYLSNSQPEVLLSVLNVSQTLSKARDPIELGVLTENELFELLVSDNESIRLAAFQLIVSTIKTSQLPREHILRLLANRDSLDGFVEDSRSPETRDAFSSLMRKAVISLKDTYIHNLASSPELTKQTLQWLQNYFIQCLSPSSSYLLLLIAFDFVEVLIEEEFDGIQRKQVKKPKKALPVLEIYDKQLVSILLRFTTNNYSDIRAKARKLLEKCGGIWEFDPINPLYREFLRNAFNGLSSLQGRKSDENVNLIMLVASQLSLDQNKFLDFLSLVQSSMESNTGSPHGFYSLYSNLIKDYSPLSKENLGFWRASCSNLLKCCQKLWLYYKLNTSFDTLEDSEGLEASSWRPIRESTLLLETMIETNDKLNYALIDEDAFLVACELTKDQLSNITHRGVFMAVFNTYVKACKLCLKRQNLKAYPIAWLQESLDIIKEKTQFVSRRSGGLPFLVTGALNALLEEDVWKHFLLMTLNELVDYTKAPLKPEDRSTVGFPQVHAFNCIKQIFLDSNLYPYSKASTETILSLALDYIDSTEWSIKNAALMLFTALHNRIFGTNMVSKLMTRMKAPAFFGMYSSLREKFISRLTTASPTHLSVESLLAILTILERLEWSATELRDEFCAILKERYSGHKMWKVRTVTARIIALMITTDERAEACKSTIHGLVNMQSNNAIHGSLLLLVNLQSQGLNILEVDIQKIYEVVSAKNRWELYSSYFDLIARHNDLNTKRTVAYQLAELLIKERTLSGPYLNGTKAKALAKLVPFLYNVHRSFKETKLAEEVLVFALWSELHELQEAALSCCENLDSPSAELRKEINEVASHSKTWSFIRIKCLKMLARHGLATEGFENEVEWSEDVKVLHLASQELPDVKELTTYLRSDISEETRLAVVETLRKIVSKAHSLSKTQYADEMCILLLLLSRSFSRSVRRIAADTLCEVYDLEKKCSTSYIFKRALEVRGTKPIDSNHVLYKFLALFNDDLGRFKRKTQTDLDRDDLHMNEALVHRCLAEYVSQGTVVYDIEDAINTIKSLAIIRAWDYDYDFVTGISKLLNIACEPDKARIRQTLKECGIYSANWSDLI